MHNNGLFVFVGEKDFQGIGVQPCLGKLLYRRAKSEVMFNQIYTQTRLGEQAFPVEATYLHIHTLLTMCAFVCVC